MKINTKRFGEIEIDPATIITLPNGILGFQEYTRYVLIDQSQKSPLKWLQNVDRTDLAFVVTDPLIFKPDYEIRIFRSDLKDIKVEDPSKVIQIVIVTVPRDPAKMTANLKGPILINLENNMGKQIILDSPDYELKYRLLKDEDVKRVANQ